MRRQRLLQSTIFLFLFGTIVFFWLTVSNSESFSRSVDKKLANSSHEPKLPELYQMLKDIKKQIETQNRQLKQQETWLEYERYRKRINMILNIDDTNKTEMFRPHVLMDNVKMECSKHYKFIVLVTSFARHFDRREFIRRTWGNHSFWGNISENWEVLFNVGTVGRDRQMIFDKLKAESDKHRDMLILDVPEDFNSMQ